MLHNQDDQSDLEGRMAALIQIFREEGQSNLAKLLEAAAYARFRRAGYNRKGSIDPLALPVELRAIIDDLKEERFPSQFIDALDRGGWIMEEGGLPQFEDTPDPCVCRLCGRIYLGDPPERCPQCGSHRWGFRRFLGTYNSDTPDPFETLKILRKMPDLLEDILEGIPEVTIDQRPEEGEWSVYQAVTHLHDAQKLLGHRLELMLENDNPNLVAEMVHEQADRVQEAAPTLRDLMESYKETRRQIVERLETIPLKEWWRPGWHTEFGQVNILHQAGYFASHEVFHLPQIVRASHLQAGY
jgi:predicted Zn-ribbon and HTH transcriptional regulator